VTARLVWPGDHHTWSWRGDVPADECVRVGTIQAVVPDVGGALDLDLELVAGRRRAGNRYRAMIRSTPKGDGSITT
jgi:hypothetical protein